MRNLSILTYEEEIELAKTTNDINILETLSKNGGIKSMYEVAKNPNTPIDILNKLSKIKKVFGDETFEVRCGVAENPNTPIDTLIKLSQDKIENVRYSVAENPNAPIDILERLSNDECEYVRMNIASNPNTPIEVLERLSNDEDIGVRESILDNPNVTKEIVTKLCEDDNISDEAMEKLATFEHNLKDTIEQASNYNDSNVDESTNSNKNNHKHR